MRHTHRQVVVVDDGVAAAVDGENVVVGREFSAFGGWVTKLYACALLIIDGLGHATWSSAMPIFRSRTAPF